MTAKSQLLDMAANKFAFQTTGTSTMRANAGLVIVGRNVTLVPYEKEHVDKYHQWMKDPWLQEMTASEPLSMEEEYEMQRSWREDDKSASLCRLDVLSILYGGVLTVLRRIFAITECTFIVLAKGPNDAESSFTDEDAIDRMAGDVNLFFNDYDDEFNCEMEIMIAEPKYRRKGFAKEAVELMMAYATSKLNVHRFYCKINEVNHASLQLFDKLGYKKCNYVAAFQEIELELLPKESEQCIVDDVLAFATFHEFPPRTN